MLIAIYAMAVLWTIGVSAVAVHIVRELMLLRPGLLFWIVTVGVGGPLVFLAIGTAWALALSQAGPDLVTLKAAEWECVETHRGAKGFVICDTYSRKR